MVEGRIPRALQARSLKLALSLSFPGDAASGVSSFQGTGRCRKLLFSSYCNFIYFHYLVEVFSCGLDLRSRNKEGDLFSGYYLSSTSLVWRVSSQSRAI